MKFLIKLFKWLFTTRYFETGSVLASHLDNEIFVPTNQEVTRVWINVMPFCDYPSPTEGCCWVSEATPVGGGFTFKCQTKGDCRINWVAEENG